ncbi:MAG: hypothetical protein COT74_12600 [Bdellovibrionales bacterium CG10_big_fil_rev_8_21_14_0_10_45_34]|nr:MAG: hypothetical protein COT74_12600 [Bdellovibrionales bacterium CG10_big_fil_rev_8_21_14_0_10_45_34]
MTKESAFGGIAVLIITLAFQNCSKVDFQQGQPKELKFSESPPPLTDDEQFQENLTKVLSLGILTKNMACVMCHTRINGDVSGFGTLTFRSDSSGTIWGNVYAADQKLQHWDFNKLILDRSVRDDLSDPQLIADVLPELITSNLEEEDGQLIIIPGEEHNKFLNVEIKEGDLYTLTHPEPARRAIAEANLPMNPFKNRPIINESDFPEFQFETCKVANKDSKGGKIVTADGTVVVSPISSNAIFVNGKYLGHQVPANSQPDDFNDYDPSCPANKTLRVEGEVLIEGDLVLAGCITGQGSIYAKGNIYVPDDIKNVNSAFPYSLTAESSTRRTEAEARLGSDMISLAAEEFILLGALDLRVIAHVEEQDPIFRTNIESIKRIYSWLAPANAEDIYNKSFLKRPYFAIDKVSGTKSKGIVALAEANLYANKGIGITLIYSKGSNIVINGSVITPNLSLLSAGFNHKHFALDGSEMTVNPMNGVRFDQSQINQDFRLRYTKKGFECHRIRATGS